MRRAALVALVAALVAIPGAHARPSATPGVTGSTILLGGSGPLSGPEVAYAGTMIGAKAYFDYVNARGGVLGRKIEYRYLDDGYDPARTVQNVRRLVQQDNVFAIFNLTGTEQNLAVRPFLNALKVPQLYGGTGVRSIGREYRKYPWSMGYLPSFYAEGRLYGRHLVSTRRNAKVAVLSEASDYGRDLVAGLKAGIGGKARIVAQTTYDVTDTDLSSQIAQLRRSGANVLMLFALPKQTIAGFVAANRFGWRPPTYVTSVSVDPAVMKIVQATTGNKAGEGALTVQWMKDSSNPANAKDPAVRLYKSIMRRYARRPERRRGRSSLRDGGRVLDGPDAPGRRPQPDAREPPPCGNAPRPPGAVHGQGNRGQDLAAGLLPDLRRPLSQVPARLLAADRQGLAGEGLTKP